MSTRQLASRYATALLQQAVSLHVLDCIQENVVAFRSLYGHAQAPLAFLDNPTIPHKKKEAVLRKLFATHFHDLTLRFFALVLQHHREAYLPQFTAAFLAQYDAHQGITHAHVTTAVPISAALQQRFQAMVHQWVPCTHVHLTHHLDPTLLGGYVLEFGDKKLDMRLTTQLQHVVHYYTSHP